MDIKQKNSTRHIRTITTASIIIVMTIFLSCDKMDENGALDGNWQLTEWRDAETDSIIATRYTYKLYYTVKLNLIKFQDMGHIASPFCLAYFRHKGDSLMIDRAFIRPDDTDIPLDSLGKYGCPADGKFTILKLTHDNMTLKSELGTLHFRKY